MYYNTQASVWRRMAEVDLARTKDVIAIASDRDSAIAVKQDILNEIDAFDHYDTGRMFRSISAVPIGDGEYAIKAVDYAKWVNGRDRLNFGSGFIDDAVNSSLLDGYDVEITV